MAREAIGECYPRNGSRTSEVARSSFSDNSLGVIFEEDCIVTWVAWLLLLLIDGASFSLLLLLLFLKCSAVVCVCECGSVLGFTSSPSHLLYDGGWEALG